MMMKRFTVAIAIWRHDRLGEMFTLIWLCGYAPDAGNHQQSEQSWTNTTLHDSPLM
jgi:hypothetical protein